MIRVVLESPFGMDPERFIPYGRAALAHSLSLGEAPMAMHLLYTQPGVLDDRKMAERLRGMEAAFMWYGAAERCVVYQDFGLSRGMQEGIDLAIKHGLPVDFRTILHRDDLSDRRFDPYPPLRAIDQTPRIE